jgi:hypothetical protein
MEKWDSFFVEEISKAPRVYDAKLKTVCEMDCNEKAAKAKREEAEDEEHEEL